LVRNIVFFVMKLKTRTVEIAALVGWTRFRSPWS
jgi:hypothetical protein